MNNKREINLCDSAANGESVIILPNESDVVVRASKELVEKMNGFSIVDEYSSPAEDERATTTTTIASQNQIMSNLSGTVDGATDDQMTSSQVVSPLLLDFFPTTLGDLRSTIDSVDGSPLPPASLHSSITTTGNNVNAVNYDVMLESVDLRARSDDDSMDNNYADLVAIEHKMSNGGGSSLWHGNVETSTDTLVPTNALTEEESKHFPGSSSSCSEGLSNFLTKREENEEMRLQRSAESGESVPNGIDCSVYGERSSFNLGLLNNQSLYMDLTPTQRTPVAVAQAALAEDNKINMMDISLIETCVIQSQPQLSSKRHRRTPSNSKSEPSPHKFQNGK